jgi:hypothetical protein
VRHDAGRRERRTQRLEQRQGFVPDQDGRDDGEPAVCRDDRADDGERPDPEGGEERQVRAGGDRPEEERRGEGARIGREPMPWTMARITTTSRLAAWAIATTAGCRAAGRRSSPSTSVEPQHSAAISP